MKYLVKYFIPLISLFFCLSCGNNVEYTKTENIQVIPKNAAIIIEGRDLKKTRDIITEVEFKKLFTESNEFSSLFNSIGELNKILEKNGASVWMSKDYSLSIHTTGSKEFGHLFIIDDIRKDAFTAVNKAISKDQIRIEHYENEDIHHIEHLNLSFVQVNQFFILSNEDILIKDAIRQHNATTDLPSDNHFQDAFKSANRSELFNVYIQTKELLALFDMTYSSSFAFLDHIDEWLALDFNVDNDRILLSGISTAQEDNRLHKMMFGTSGRKTDVFEYLPSSTHFCVSKLFPNIDQYMTSRIKTLEHEQRLEAWKKYKKDVDFNAEDFLKTFGNEYTYAICGSEITPSNAVGLLKLEDLEKAKRFFKVSDLPKYRSYSFRQLEDNKIFDFILGDFFKDFKNAHCVIIDDFAIFSNETSNLKSIINDYLGETTLAHQETFTSLKKELSSKSNIWMYISEDALQVFPEQMARKKFKDQQKEVGNKIKNLGKVFAQIQIEDDYFQINLVGKNPKKEWKAPELKSDWSLELDNTFDMAPQKLWNHVNKKYEIAVQDKGNILYLISDMGKILWKKQLDDKIIGDIQQIDIYRNKRYQMLIQTKNKILLLDRNGKMVDGYPIKLPSQSSGPMAVFDYDKTKKYRILIPCTQHLAMYDQKGKRVKGWNAYNQSHAIVTKPQHFIVNNKDYIVSVNETGETVVLKRNGETRFKVKSKIKPHPYGVFKSLDKNKVQFQMLTQNGSFATIFKDGSIENTPGPEGEILAAHFNQNACCYIFKDKFEHIYKEESYTHDLELGSNQVHLSPYKDDYFSLVDKASEKVYIFNNKGKLLKNFPIYGSTKSLLARMNSKSYLKLFVGGNDGTLYSYQISK